MEIKEKIGWAIAQGVVGCWITIMGVTFAIGLALAAWAIWDEMIRPFIDTFGLYTLIVPPILLALSYLGWLAAGKIIHWKP